MRINAPPHTERFGAVRIHGVQEVWELDSGRETLSSPTELDWQTVLQIPAAWISDIERQMAIVVPCKNERLKVIYGESCQLELEAAPERGTIARVRIPDVDISFLRAS